MNTQSLKTSAASTSKSSAVVLTKPPSQKGIVMKEPNTNNKKTDDSSLKGKGKAAVQTVGMAAQSLSSVPLKPTLDQKNFPHPP